MVAQALKKKNSDQYVVVKEDCIGHIQKCMGLNLIIVVLQLDKTLEI